MKYKVLLTGTHQTLISDFFNHMEFNLECLSSSTRIMDVMGHLKYFHPDAVIFCLHNETQNEISGLGGVIQKVSAESIPLIIVGEQESCELFEKIFPMSVGLTIKKPFSIKGLEERLLSYLRQHTADKGKAGEAEELMEASEGIMQMSGITSQELREILALDESLSGEEMGDKKKHILIVDDDSRVLRLVKGVLGNRYNVATAINGKVAMKFLENKETDLILLDYEMPGESGAQILQRIRSNPKLQKLPVVFLTGVTERKRIKEVLELAPQGYLLKPIDTGRLYVTLEKLLGE